MSKHLSRKELIEAARSPVSRHSEHLAECQECREALELIMAYKVAGRVRLPHAPVAVVDRAVSIISGSRVRQKMAQMLAKLSFDSWTMPAPATVRGQANVSDRRLRFEAGPITLDIRAERQDSKWTFVAQVTGIEQQLATIAIEADSKTCRPDRSGLYQWSSARPPRQLKLRLVDGVVATPRLQWKRPRSK